MQLETHVLHALQLLPQSRLVDLFIGGMESLLIPLFQIGAPKVLASFWIVYSPKCTQCSLRARFSLQ